MDNFPDFNNEKKPADVSTSAWLFYIILLFIPPINIILILYWMFSKDTPPTLKNFAQAAFVFMMVFMTIVIIAGFFFLKNLAF